MKKEKTGKINPHLLIASFSALFIYMKQASIMNEQTQILLNQSKFLALH